MIEEAASRSKLLLLRSIALQPRSGVLGPRLSARRGKTPFLDGRRPAQLIRDEIVTGMPVELFESAPK
jgi:hypothetical protein